jgi:hypothetical protein
MYLMLSLLSNESVGEYSSRRRNGSGTLSWSFQAERLQEASEEPASVPH